MSLPMTASPALNARANESKTPATPAIRYLCFGAFQLDTQREVLFKDGAKVRLPGKVFQTLLALLEKPGEVLTRGTLRERLWPEGTYVNYDANVNTTVNKLRLVLGDSPDQPVYIETIPRLGYCFVGNVERKSELPKPAAQTAPAKRESAILPLLVEPANALAAPTEAGRALRSDFWSSSRNKVWAGVVLLCGMLIGMGIVLLAHRA
jgi:DNA-binding winged helix-turn-helix (wHTH) protein